MGYTENINSILKWGNSFQRQFDFPLDRSSLHGSYEDAVAYAKGDGSDSRGLGGQAYIGQTITVWGLNEKGVEGVWVYSLVPSINEGHLADLKPVGSGSATEIAEKYSVAKELSKDLVVGQLIKVTNDEEVKESEGSDSDSDSDVVVNVYKAGFYIVNAPGSISSIGTSDEIAILEEKVNVDIANLSTHMTEASIILCEVDDRLKDLESFVDAHESIDVTDIENLFA